MMLRMFVQTHVRHHCSPLYDRLGLMTWTQQRDTFETSRTSRVSTRLNVLKTLSGCAWTIKQSSGWSWTGLLIWWLWRPNARTRKDTDILGLYCRDWTAAVGRVGPPCLLLAYSVWGLKNDSAELIWRPVHQRPFQNISFVAHGDGETFFCDSLTGHSLTHRSHAWVCVTATQMWQSATLSHRHSLRPISDS